MSDVRLIFSRNLVKLLSGFRFGRLAVERELMPFIESLPVYFTKYSDGRSGQYANGHYIGTLENPYRWSVEQHGNYWGGEPDDPRDRLFFYYSNEKYQAGRTPEDKPFIYVELDVEWLKGNKPLQGNCTCEKEEEETEMEVAK